jgi:hypothetical protein
MRDPADAPAPIDERADDAAGKAADSVERRLNGGEVDSGT